MGISREGNSFLWVICPGGSIHEGLNLLPGQLIDYDLFPPQS